ncbi:hypothetical protein [Sneathiella limimaris]|uniref:hypothetical protein n=1 Tax=Sneathiella limimaris TaxID=1964213 RepID=UPI00146CEB76|nr:hypothetical protein [Sneathiella limimaris]
MSKDFDDDLEEDLEPSSLDDNTHAEMLALYRESTRTILYAKTRQWRTLAAACFAQIIIVAAGHLIQLDPSVHRALVIISFLVSAMAISILLIFQIWQHTEVLKIRKITSFLSGHFGTVRAVKSRVEANIHRYILLAVMIISILITNTISYIAYVPLLPVSN